MHNATMHDVLIDRTASNATSRDAANTEQLHDLQRLAAEADAGVRSAVVALNESTAMLQAREASRISLGPFTLAQFAQLVNYLASSAALTELQQRFLQPVARFLDSTAAALRQELAFATELELMCSRTHEDMNGLSTLLSNVTLDKAAVSNLTALWTQTNRSMFFSQQEMTQLVRNIRKWSESFSRHRRSVSIVGRSFGRNLKFQLDELSRLSNILNSPDLGDINASAVLSNAVPSLLLSASNNSHRLFTVERLKEGYRRLVNTSTASMYAAMQAAFKSRPACASSATDRQHPSDAVWPATSFVETSESAVDLAASAKPTSHQHPRAKGPVRAKRPAHSDPARKLKKPSTVQHAKPAKHAAKGAKTPKQPSAARTHAKIAHGDKRALRQSHMGPGAHAGRVTVSPAETEPNLTQALQSLAALAQLPQHGLRTLRLPSSPGMPAELSAAQRKVVQTATVAAKLSTQLIDAVVPIEKMAAHVQKVADESITAVSTQRSGLMHLLSQVHNRLDELVSGARSALAPFQPESTNNPAAKAQLEVEALAQQLLQQRRHLEQLENMQQVYTSMVGNEAGVRDQLFCVANASSTTTLLAQDSLHGVVLQARASSTIAKLSTERQRAAAVLLGSASAFDQTKVRTAGGIADASSMGTTSLKNAVDHATSLWLAAQQTSKRAAEAALAATVQGLSATQHLTHTILSLEETIADAFAQFEAQQQANTSTDLRVHVSAASDKRKLERALGAPVVSDQNVDSVVADGAMERSPDGRQKDMDKLGSQSILDSINFLRGATSQLSQRAASLYELQRLHCHYLAGALTFFVEAEQAEGLTEDAMRRAVRYLNSTDASGDVNVSLRSRPMQSAVAVVLATAKESPRNSSIQNTIRVCASALPTILYHLNISMAYQTHTNLPAPTRDFSESIVAAAANRTAALSGFIGENVLGETLDHLTQSYRGVDGIVNSVEGAFTRALTSAVNTQALQAKADKIKIRFAKVYAAETAIRQSSGNLSSAAKGSDLFDAALILATQEEAGTSGFIQKAFSGVSEVLQFSQHFVADAAAAFADIKQRSRRLQAVSSPVAAHLTMIGAARTKAAEATLHDVESLVAKNHSLHRYLAVAHNASHELDVLQRMQLQFGPVTDDIRNSLLSVSRPLLDPPQQNTHLPVDSGQILLGKCHAVSTLSHFLTPALKSFNNVSAEARKMHAIFSASLLDIQESLKRRRDSLQKEAASAQDKAQVSKRALDELHSRRVEQCRSSAVYSSDPSSKNTDAFQVPGTELDPDSTVLRLAMDNTASGVGSLDRHLKLLESRRCVKAYQDVALATVTFTQARATAERTQERYSQVQAATLKVVKAIGDLLQLDADEKARHSSLGMPAPESLLKATSTLRQLCSTAPKRVPDLRELAETQPLKLLVQDASVFASQARVASFEGAVVRQANFSDIVHHLAAVDSITDQGQSANASAGHAVVFGANLTSRAQALLQARRSFELQRREMILDLDQLQLACVLSGEYTVFIDNLILLSSIHNARVVATTEKDTAHHIEGTAARAVSNISRLVQSANSQSRHLLQSLQLANAVPVIDHLERTEFLNVLKPDRQNLSDALLYLLNDNRTGHPNALEVSISALSNLWTNCINAARAAGATLNAHIADLQMRVHNLKTQITAGLGQQKRSLGLIGSAIEAAVPLLNDSQLSQLFLNDSSLDVSHIQFFKSELQERMGMLHVVVGELDHARHALRDHYDASVDEAHAICGSPKPSVLPHDGPAKPAVHPPPVVVPSGRGTVPLIPSTKQRFVFPCYDDGAPCSREPKRYAALYVMEPIIEDEPREERSTLQGGRRRGRKLRGQRHRAHGNRFQSFLQEDMDTSATGLAPNTRTDRYNVSDVVSRFKSCARHSLAVANALSAYQRSQLDFKVATDQWKTLAQLLGVVDSAARQFVAVNGSLVTAKKSLVESQSLMSQMRTVADELNSTHHRARAGVDALQSIVESPSIQLRQLSEAERVQVQNRILRIFGLDVSSGLCVSNCSRNDAVAPGSPAAALNSLTKGAIAAARVAARDAAQVLQDVHTRSLLGEQLGPEALAQLSNTSTALRSYFQQNGSASARPVVDTRSLTDSILKAVQLCVVAMQPIKQTYSSVNAILKEAASNDEYIVGLQVCRDCYFSSVL